jgi:hypothetical protein
VKAESIAWLWDQYIPLGNLSIIEGDPGVLKSTITLDLVARVTTGRDFPDGSPCGAQGGAVLLSAEDSISNTIRPRLEAAGADLEKVIGLETIRDENNEPRPITFPRDVEYLRAAINEVSATVVIIDPLTAFHDKDVNSYSDTNVRTMLAPLKALAEETGVAIVVVRHWKKGGESNAKHKGGGSIAYTGAARSVFCVADEPSEEDGEQHYIFAHVKHNLAPRQPSLRFRGESVNDTVLIDWLGTSDLLASDLTDPDRRGNIDDAVEVLRDLLKGGAKQKESDVRRAVLNQTSVSISTYKRARTRAGVQSAPFGFQGPSMVWLPSPSEASGDHQYDDDERAGMEAF